MLVKLQRNDCLKWIVKTWWLKNVLRLGDTSFVAKSKFCWSFDSWIESLAAKALHGFFKWREKIDFENRNVHKRQSLTINRIHLPSVSVLTQIKRWKIANFGIRIWEKDGIKKV